MTISAPRPSPVTKRAAISHPMVGAAAAAQRGDAEDRQIELIGETTAEMIAEKTCPERADDHARECRGDKLRVQRQGRPSAMQQGTQHRPGKIDVETVEEHAGPDDEQQAAMEPGDRQPVEPGGEGRRHRGLDVVRKCGG